MRKALCIAALLVVAHAVCRAQCSLQNKAFAGGERLEYKLYFNWKFVWLNAGDAEMTIEETQRDGKPAYSAHLLTTTSKRIDKYFCMRDTIESVVTDDLVPLYYRKGANEGGKHRLNEVHYSYPGGKTHTRLLYVNPAGEATSYTLSNADCVYDMMSMMLRARSLSAEGMQVGDKLQFLMADGRRVETQTLVYRGKKNFKSEEEGTTYRCLVFSFVEYVGKKEKEVVTFYITDDDNHLPVRLDMFLRFGVAKAYLRSSQGVRHAQTSIVKKK